MQLWAIRQISTGFYLPYRKNGKGFTADHPSNIAIPRLFNKKSAATNALRWWLRGIWSAKYFNGDRDIEVIYAPERKADDMEVVEMTLKPCNRRKV